MDRHLRPRPRHARHPHRRSGLRPLPLRRSRKSASPPRRSSTGPTDAKFTGDAQQTSSRTSAARSTAPRSSPTRRATCCCANAAKEFKLEAQLRRHRAHVARRLHHPQPLPRQHQGRLRQEPEPHQPAARPLLLRRAQEVPGRLAPHRRARRRRSASRRRPSPPRSRSTTATARARLPANLLQAQRDYFGAHTYERIDKPRGEFFHTNWTGHGGTTASTTYNA